MAHYFPHPQALVESDQIGDGTRIAPFAHVMHGAIIGGGCVIGAHCLVENDVHVGDHVVVNNGASICRGVTLEDCVLVGPGAAFTNEKLPRAKVIHLDPEQTRVRQGASIGAHATVLDGITIGRHAFVGAGSVVTRAVPDYALVYGNPARQRGWVCVCGQPLNLPLQGTAEATCACGRSYRLAEAGLSEES